MSTKTKRLTESAMLLAIAIVLELMAKLFIPELPFGGRKTNKLEVGALMTRVEGGNADA